MRRALPALLAVAALGGWVACDKVTPVAPTDSTLTISANPTRIDVDGEAIITVIARKGDGTPVNPGTQINFSTTLGTIDQVSATDPTGVARATLTGDGRVGVATVRASSGAAGEVEVMVEIGASAASLTLQATPTSLPRIGGEVKLLALVRDDKGQPLKDTFVNFQSDVGVLESLGSALLTNAKGEAQDKLTVVESDLLVLRDTFFEVRAQVAGADGLLIEAIFEIEIRGFATSISLQATPSNIPEAGGQAILRALVRDSFGNPLEGALVNFLTDLGDLASGGGVIPTSAGGQAEDTLSVSQQQVDAFSGNNFRVRAQTGGFGGGAALEATFTLQITSSAPVASFTFSGASGSSTVSFTFTGSGEEPLSFAWDFDLVGTFSVDSTLRNPTFTYGTPGAKTVRLEVRNAFNPEPEPPAVATATITIPIP